MKDTPPFPALADRTTGDYNGRAFAFGTHMADTFNGELLAVAENVLNNATEAYQDALAAEESAASAKADAESAARDAATAASAPGTNATSTTSMALGLGTKTFTLVQAGKLFGKGNTVTVAAPTGDNWMAGPITSFNPTAGEMTVNVTNISGSGTFTDWRISLAGAAGLTGVVNELRANNVASASTVNLTAATGNLVHITGTTTITAFTLASGAERSVIFDGALTLTNGAGLLLPGAANIVTAAGDRALVRGDSNGAIVTHYQRASGLPVVGGVISKEYVSPDQVIVNSASVTFTHGLGTLPKLMQGYLRCVVAYSGYVVGDVIPVANTSSGNFSWGRITSSQIQMRFNSGVTAGADGSNPFGPGYPDANWRFFIEAFA